MPLLILIALLCGLFAPSAPVQEPEPPPEIRIGDVAQIADIDEVKDANAPKGTYRKTDNGWAFVPDTATAAEPPKIAASAKAEPMTDESAATAGGAVILIAIAAVLLKFSGVGKKKGKAANITQNAEIQTLVRRLDNMARIMEGVTPDAERGKRK